MSEAAFTAALLNPEAPVPAGLHGPSGAPVGKRFAVYRNNVAVSLTEALRKTFPIIRKLVGEEFFDAMSAVYLRAEPPASPIIAQYGGGFAGFLQGFPPAAKLGYLPDMARMEFALVTAYHAADARPIDGAKVAAMPPDRLAVARLRFAPAVTLIRSEWPVLTIWKANRAEGAPPAKRQAEDVVILRPGFDPLPHLLPEGCGAALADLLDGQPIGQAIEATGADPAALFGLMAGGGAITGILEDGR